mgnify:CR=1 FL=1|tara:strand:- start:581 stop:862 length:282 start_codon:yes stop_codon:yes gene_type:complete
MRKILLIFLLLLATVGGVHSQTVINCYSQTSRFLGVAYLYPNEDKVMIYSSDGYYIGFLIIKDAPYNYYNVEGELKAQVYIDTTQNKAIFYFL